MPAYQNKGIQYDNYFWSIKKNYNSNIVVLNYKGEACNF